VPLSPCLFHASAVHVWENFSPGGLRVVYARNTADNSLLPVCASLSLSLPRQRRARVGELLPGRAARRLRAQHRGQQPAAGVCRVPT
jgi:hypothetical protein